MIFLTYSKAYCEAYNLDEVVSIAESEWEKRDFRLCVIADTIFRFENGKTIYIKNRFGSPLNGYQYSEEEIILLRLKASSL